MRARDARRARKALRPEQRSFIDVPRVSARMPVRDWLRFLGPVAAADAARDSVRGLGRLARPKDVPDALRDCVVPLLQVLEEESGGRTPLALALDLTGPEAAAKMVGPEVQLPPWRPDILRCDEANFWDPWLVGETTLGDGTALRFHVATTVRRRKLRKRGAGGKVKWKTKSRVRTVTEARIAARCDALALVGAPVPVDAGDRFKVKVAGDRAAVRLRSTIAGADPKLGLAELLRLVSDAHHQFTPTGGGEP